MSAADAELYLHNGRISTLDPTRPDAHSISIKGGRVVALDPPPPASQGGATRIDLQGRRVIPGLNDSHLHVIRGGLQFNMELRWDGVPSLADALRMLKEQAGRTPPGQWVRVVGGWSEFQFAERRMPTLDEINAVAEDTPVFILHLYCRAMLNRAALRACGYTRQSQNPPGAEIQRDSAGNPTGMLIARPNATILYSTLAMGPKLPPEHQVNSTRHFMRELNRLGLTSIIDAGGGFQNYPDDYGVIQQLHRDGQLTLRIAYNLFTQRPGQEKDDFARWIGVTRPGAGDAFLRCNGAGEMLVFSAADFEDFLEPRPDLPEAMESQLEEVVSLLARNRWPFRLHATYDESIARFLTVFEKVHRASPLTGLNWFFDHCETVSEKSLDRIKALGGGIAIQHRMAFQGEYFAERYGAKAAGRTPPIRKMLERGIPVGAGTDATRVASYNPWASLHWMVTGKTAGGMQLFDSDNRLTRDEALRLYTRGSSWFSGESDCKGALAPGQFADLAVLTDDYFSVPDDRIKSIESLLTVVDGRIVHAAGPFSSFAPPPLPVSPEWSPLSVFGGYGAPLDVRKAARAGVPVPTGGAGAAGPPAPPHRCHHTGRIEGTSTTRGFWGAGCDCFAF